MEVVDELSVVEDVVADPSLGEEARVVSMMGLIAAAMRDVMARATTRASALMPAMGRREPGSEASVPGFGMSV